MKRATRVTLPVLSALLLILIGPMKAELSTDRSTDVIEGGETAPPFSSKSNGAQEFKEYDYRFDGAKWVPAWFLCDGEREVAVFSEDGKGKAIRYESFSKRQPSKTTILSLTQKGEPDCGMMKCYYTFVAQGKKFSVMESHYKDDEAFWTMSHMIGVGPPKKEVSAEQECRWFERTRVGIITDRRSIYITESETGDLQYQSFNYDQASEKPSVMLKGGVRTLDAGKGIETFTFESGEYAYVINVSTVESRPSVEVLVKRNGALAQKERCLSYTYVRKP